RCRRRRWSWSMCAPSRWASPRRRRRRRSRAGRPPPRAVAAVAPGWPRRPPSPTPTSSTARRSAPARGSRGPRSSRCRPRRSWWRRASPSRSIGTARSWWRDDETSCVKPEARHGCAGARPSDGGCGGPYRGPPRRMTRRHVVVGTAGHIDHGKTSLVKALTGTDTDRLPEEKARGITIDLGFAFLEEPDGLTIEIVDVPGHERFVKNMLAGVGGIDLALLVIAADEGVMPQTREHLAICQLLRIKSGMVALTKTDLAEADWIELVKDDVTRLLDGTFLAGCPIVPVSVKTGQGLPELRQTLARLAAGVSGRATDQTARLPIDRVFTIKGFGTVVTGTLMAGRLAVDDRVEIFPRGIQAKVRGLQVHGHAVSSAQAGQRTAVNLQGVERSAIERGDVLAPVAGLVTTLLVDATLELLADAPRPLKARDRVRFHVGTQEVMARVLLVDRL